VRAEREGQSQQVPDRKPTSRPQRKIAVGILGATGTVGQQFAALLEGHPWFELEWLAASERSAGKHYAGFPWRLPAPLPDQTARLTVESPKPGAGPKLVFSALDASVAGDLETQFAAAGHVVVSNARNHRMDPLVPLLIPEVNADHLGLVPLQQKRNGWRGAIVTNPNCSAVILALTLAALRPFQLKRVLVTTMQALSGAGYPGVASLDATANVIPYIEGEEEKIEAETRKILGRLRRGTVELHPVAISATTTRVPVVHGHTESVSVELGKEAARETILAAFEKFSGEPQKLKLPSAPAHPIVCLDSADRPQPRLDVERDGGMTVQIGRLRYCHVLDYKFIALGHNTIRGAAGAAILNAELLAANRLLD
jgi:aspartate-semialdehyde dehydrogenase